MKTKVITYYLPQFYETEYNNEWWGKGFTEWVHVRTAEPLFEGQEQPRIPLNNNYYNLLDKKTVEWQTELANKYGIYGFAYYHYWFNGKLLLEKPAENLLKWKEIDQKFFFFWANHTWYKADNGRKSVLLEQIDNGKADWLAHYQYMRRFFEDRRYIKIDNKPVVGIYSMSMLNNPEAMIATWNEQAVKDGYAGVYIIENRIKKNERKHSLKTDAVVCRQPLVAMNEHNLKLYKRVFRKFLKLINYVPNKPQMISYEVITRLERQYDSELDEKEFLGCSVGWDNTPRHKNYGQVFTNASPELFRETVRQLLIKSEERGNELFFINAWNEWAEGMYLEPDESNKYKYLEAIKEAIKECEDICNAKQNNQGSCKG